MEALSICSERHLVADSLHERAVELVFCTMQHDAQILSRDAEFTADLVTIALVEKNSFQERTIARRHVQQDLAHFLRELLRCRCIKSASSFSSGLGCSFLVQRFATA